VSSGDEDCLEGAPEGAPEEGRGGKSSIVRTRDQGREARREEEIVGEGGSCTERRGVVISMTGGVEGAEREGNRRLFVFFFSFFMIMYSLIKVQETVWSASYDRNKTYKQSNDPLHPLIGKIKPLQSRAHPPPT